MSKQPKYLRKFDPNRDAHSNWKEADELYFGWFAYSPFELQERYRDTASEAAAISLQLEMQWLVRDRIAAAEIFAFGVQISPELRDKAEPLPQILFQSAEVKIDWEQGHVSGLGRKFNDVRICLSAISEGAPKAQIAVAQPNSKRSGGRRSQYPEAREVLRELYAEHPAYRALSANRLLNAFNERYLAKFTPPGGSLAPVGERSLRDHLKEYRKELAGTGES